MPKIKNKTYKITLHCIAANKYMQLVLRDKCTYQQHTHTSTYMPRHCDKMQSPACTYKCTSCTTLLLFILTRYAQELHASLTSSYCQSYIAKPGPCPSNARGNNYFHEHNSRIGKRLLHVAMTTRQLSNYFQTSYY